VIPVQSGHSFDETDFFGWSSAVSILLAKCQRPLTFHRPDSRLRAWALPVSSGRRAHIPGDGPFLGVLLSPWRECIALDIRNGLPSTGCCSITSTGSFPNMRADSSGSTASSGGSSRRWPKAITRPAGPW